MGFTIEDMLLISREKYSMELVAGQNGWSNSISWLLMLEDVTITRNFSGKELAVTTGLGFQSEERQLILTNNLIEHNAAGLIVNTGKYIEKIPDSVIELCDRNDFPLLTVPWDVYLADMIKDLSIRVFLQGSTDEQISSALIRAIENPGEVEVSRKELLPYFDTDGTFQVFLITSEHLDTMDTVERKRISYRLQIYLANITHNGHFFYYDSDFVLVMNAVSDEDSEHIIMDFKERARRRIPELSLWIGAGSKVTDVTKLHIAYQRAKAAVRMAKDRNEKLVWFDDMGVYRLLYLVEDRDLLNEMGTNLLAKLIDYDEKHDANYVETLEQYLMHDQSIQAVSEAMYTHRNTIMYRLKNIKKILNTELDTQEERLSYMIACKVIHMRKMN